MGIQAIVASWRGRRFCTFCNRVVIWQYNGLARTHTAPNRIAFARVPSGPSTWTERFFARRAGPTIEKSITLQRDKIKPILLSIVKHSSAEELKRQLPKDVLSGVMVAVGALPSSIALAIASGVSRVQISGPTAA